MKRRNFLENREAGILILRIGLGLILISQGYPTIFGGPEVWGQAGQVIQYIGIESMPVFFGFIIGIIKLIGGLFLIFGLYFRPALSLLIIMELFITAVHIGQTDPFDSILKPIILLIVFVSLLFLGAGKYNLDKKLKKRRPRRRF